MQLTGAKSRKRQFLAASHCPPSLELQTQYCLWPSRIAAYHAHPSQRVIHTGRRFHSESTLQDIEIGSLDPDLDV
jgi:hypothetical protein